MDVFDILTITKEASGVSSVAMSAMHNFSDDAYKAARAVARHFRVSDADNIALYRTKVAELPRRRFSFPLSIEIIPPHVNARPDFDLYANVVTTYAEPWSYMHEFAHAENRPAVLKKLEHVLNWKNRISPEDQILYDNYINNYYRVGNKRSRALGDNIDNIIQSTKGMREKEVAKVLDEFRASAKAISDTERLHSRKLADKVFQPMSVLDASRVDEWHSK